MTRVGFTYLLRKHVSRAAQTCPSLKEKRVSTARAAAQLRDDDLSGDRRLALGRALARPCPDANDRKAEMAA